MITVKDLAFYLIDKKEHYPLSDEFIAQYRQCKGGYIDFAIKTGHSADQKRYEPNQKWHFYESWLIRSLQDGTISWEDNAKVIYSKIISCPEWLLWFLEAVGIEPSDVAVAKKIAEDGKKKNIAVGTIAKEIRRRIRWEVIENAIKA